MGKEKGSFAIDACFGIAPCVLGRSFRCAPDRPIPRRESHHMFKRSITLLLLSGVVIAVSNAPAWSKPPISTPWQLAPATHIQAGAIAKSAYAVAAMVELRNICYQGRMRNSGIPTDPKSPKFFVEMRQYGGPMCGQVDRLCYVTSKVVGPIPTYIVIASKGDFVPIALTKVRVKTTAPVMTPPCPRIM